MENSSEDTLLPQARVSLGWALLFLLLVAAIFNYPLYPSADLDASWRSALGYFFQHGFQFGRDVVFTYGPLGFVMGKTYSGLQFSAIVAGQLAVALVGAAVIIGEGRRLQGLSRWAFFVGFLLFGAQYEDALHMLVISLIGFRLLRAGDGRWVTALLALALAGFAVVKFTNLLLASLIVGVTVAHALWRRRGGETARLAAVFGGGFLAIWLACGQNPLNLPDFLRLSWSISQGYTEAMGYPTPWPPLWKAFVVLGIIAGYLLLHVRLNPDRPRALANATLLAGFIFLNWKHGFVRADGHMIGFFFCALLPLTAYPALLDDPPRLRRVHYAAFILAGFMCLWGLESALYGTFRMCAGLFQEKVWKNIEWTFHPAETRQRYHDRLLQQRDAVSLDRTRKLVGRASVDVLGYEQAVALFNGFNYRPRPIFQSYSAYTPDLARLNGDYYASDRAPEYVLLKLQTIDGRLPMLDDPEVWRLLPQRYDFVQAEKGFQLWRRLPGRFDPAAGAPVPRQQLELAVGDTLPLDAYAGQQLWARLDLQPTWLGRLHTFFYKPPRVKLVLKDEAGNETEFRLNLPQSRAGFILSPLIEDIISYAGFANGRPGREVRSLRLQIKPGDRLLFADHARIELSVLKPAGTAGLFFNQASAELFHMFKKFPIQHEAHSPVSEESMEGRQVAVLHAPSEMVFNLPPKAQMASGRFGFLPGTYTNGGNTNGAEFVVSWSNGSTRVDLFRRYLDPVHHVEDRGLKEFSAALGQLTGGRLYLRIEPGPLGNYSWDWTVWTDIDIK